MKKLKNILQFKIFYLILIILLLIYTFIYIKKYHLKYEYNIGINNLYLTIKDYNIKKDKIIITFKEGIIGYFDDKDYFMNNISLNDKIHINGTINSLNNNTIPNTFNYKKYMYYKNIGYSININKITIYKNNKNIFYKLKNNIYKRINNIKHNEYLYAFLLGKTSFIDEEDYSNYKTIGITHLFAISGMHIAIITSIIYFILKLIKLNGKTKLILITPILIFIMFLCSYTPSILRASISFIIHKLNKILKLNLNDLKNYIITLIIILFINPLYIFNNGFLLSFIISFFIMISNTKSILKTSLLCFISSLPIILNMNYEINIISFINNILFIPYITYIVFPLSLINILIPKLNFILNFFIKIMEKLSYISSNYLNITIIFGKQNIFVIIIFYILLILIIKKHKKSLIFLLIILINLMYLKINKNELYVNYLDVSQGDSILITYKNNNVLIDTGNNDSNRMINKIIPYFKSKKIKKINYLILTHGDSDHIGEAINLIENFKVENVIFNCGEYNNLENELIKKLKQKNIKYNSCIVELNIDKYKLQFLNTMNFDNENDNSSVIYLKYNDYKFLFMGDASIEKEKEILNKYNLTNIDFLKVGHHGSNTSTSEELIKQTKPKYSIISVGKNNRYGHPKKIVLDILKNSNSKIYRTDEDGSIEIRIKSDGYTIETCEP